jgi:ATP-dependent phosphofructokinase / diphosphate-dependent phosphofructokinase
MRMGILTGGGDCPGLNAVIRAVVRKAARGGDEVVGILHGWRGMLSGEHMELGLASVSGLLPRGGTILHTSRTNVYKEEGGEEKVKKTMRDLRLDALIACGGEDTLGAASKLWKAGVPVVGVPKTIDNDLSGTYFTFGFDTAVSIVTEAIDRLHTTAESHDRVMVCEVMGRHAGWIATYGGLAGGADVILIPEKPFNLDEVAAVIKRRHSGGKTFSIVVASEGARPDSAGEKGLITQGAEVDAFGHVRLGGIGNFLAKEMEKRTGFETRVTVLGHVQRGGSPTAHDRILATRFGIKAVEMVRERQFGMMAGLTGNSIEAVPLEVAVGTLKTVDAATFAIAEVFFG